MIVAAISFFTFTILIVASAAAFRTILQTRVRIGRRFGTTDGIDELAVWRIGGVDQWVQLRGASRHSPILIYLHGGPGMPAMPFAHAFQRSWEKQYIVVHWDQRNAGKTLTSNGIEAGLTLDQHVADGLEIVDTLRRRFPSSPIIIFGQSWGTAIGLEMVRRNEFECSVYIANGQVSDFLKAEQYGFQAVLAEARLRNDQDTVEKLLRYDGYPHVEPFAQALGTVRAAELKLGFGHHSNPKIMMRMLWLAFQSPDYAWRDLLSLQNRKAQAASLRLGLTELPRFAERVMGAKLSCPIIITGGEFDLFTPTAMARELFDTLDAPKKVFIDLEGVAHFGPSEAPKQFDDIVLKDAFSLVNRALQTTRHLSPQFH